MSKLLTLDEAAEILRVSRYTVKRYINDGKIESVKYDRKVLIEPAAIDEFIKNRKRRGTKKPTDVA